MYKVNGLKTDNCDGNDRHAGIEVLAVEDLVTGQSLHLCVKCFVAQMKLRSKGKKPESRTAPERFNGVPESSHG